MKYVDDKGRSYEISYSQRLQKEQNRIARQKNQLLFAILTVLIAFGLGALWVLFRLAYTDFLTQLLGALSALA